MDHRSTSQSGQILLITLLVLSIATTVALGVISRTTTDSNITNQQEESAKAFHAAEAGVEAALQQGPAVGNAPVTLSSGDVSYKVQTSAIGGTSSVYVFPKKTTRNLTETVWLVGHKTDGTIDESVVYGGNSVDLCWSREAIAPAVIVSIVYKEGSGTDPEVGMYKAAFGAYDPISRGNEFDGASTGSTTCGSDFGYSKNIQFSDFNITPNGANRDIPFLIRIRPVYSDAMIAVNPQGGFALPTQANQYDVTGTVGSGVTRRILATQYYPAPGSVFDHAVYSQTGFSY